VKASQANTFWLTGLSGAGKSTLARALFSRLKERGHLGYVLDGDEMREGLCSDLGYSPEARAENNRRLAEVAKLMNRAGVHVIVAAISPGATSRALAHQIVGADNFFEIYVETPLKTCIDRDPKGYYARAMAGELKQFTGISANYEAPTKPAFRIDTASQPLEVSAGALSDFVLSQIEP
jgi:adenylylsulfate kinase